MFHETHRKRFLHSPWVGRDFVPKFKDLKLVKINNIIAIIIIIIIMNNFIYTYIGLLLVETIVRVVNHCRLHFHEPHIMKRSTTIIFTTTR